MQYFLCSNLCVRINDVKNVWIERDLDKIYFKMVGGEIKSAENGMQLMDEFKQIKMICDLRSYMFEHRLTPTFIARKIGVSAPAICNLYNNNKISPKIEERINKCYPYAFRGLEDIFKNPLQTE